MAKTNPSNTRQSATLAFDDAQAGDLPRPAAPRRRLRPDNFDDDFGDELDQEARPGPRTSDGRQAIDSRPRRRTPIPQSRWANFRWSPFLFRTRPGFALLCLALLTLSVLLVLACRTIRGFLEQDPHFRIATSSSIQIIGAGSGIPGSPGSEDSGGLTRTDLLGVFASDIGRNIFFVPLAKRREQLEQLPWVAHATVMRLLPDRLSVSVTERVPIAFVRLGSRIGLVDAQGVLLSLPPAIVASRHYSFPVVAGLAPTDTPEARAARMQLYQKFVTELDHVENGAQPGNSPISSQLSEVDLSDLEDVRALVPAQGTDILLHFGNSDFLTRYRSYQAHLGEWRQQYPHLSAIDLRYDRQVVLKMSDGAESETASVDPSLNRENSLTAAPSTASARPAAHPPAHINPHHPAGHGAAHGWKPL